MKRGIRIPLTEKSWRLVVEALYYVADSPNADELEEQRPECAKIAKYIERRLESTKIKEG